MRITPEFVAFMDRYGIHTGATEFIEPEWKRDFGYAMDSVPHLGMDAQSALITTANAGVPALLSTMIDPQVVEILSAPTNAARIYGESKRGDWTTTAVEFPIVERTGFSSSYGDWNNNGASGMNVNWLSRQPYLFQVIGQWGEHEMARYALAGLDYVAQVNMASAMVITKFLNKSYFFGITGIQCYGAINDPNLIAPIAPTTKVAGGTTWANGTAQEIFNDINKLYGQLVSQMGGNLVNVDAAMTLTVPTTQMFNLNKVSSFNVSAIQTIKMTFPNLRIESAPEYSTLSGDLLQLFLPSFEGVDTVFAAFTEKMRNHAVVTDLSGWKQKKSAGTMGSVNRRPIALASMIGI